MKMYNIHLSVQISEINEYPAEPKSETPSLESVVGDRQIDSPIRDQARLLDAYLGKLNLPGGSTPAIMFPVAPSENLQFNQNVKFVAKNFSELLDAANKIYAAAKSLNPEIS